MKKSNSSGSLPEIVEAIDRAYDLAFSLVSRLRFAEAFTTQAADLAVIAFFEGEDEEQRIAESIAQAKGKLFDRRSELIELRELIDSDLEGLREAFLGVTIEVFEFSYAETSDFETTGDQAVYASLTTLAYAVRKWIGETIGYLGALDCFVDLQNCNDLADGFPMNQNFERAIRKRLLFEKSILCRNVKAYAESRGIIGTTTTTTPQGRKKSEKTLSKAEDQLTLAAAAWLHYRNLSTVKEIKILKRDVYPIAKQLGFKGTYQEFQKKSNDGAKGPYKEATIRRMKEINFPLETSFLGDL